MGQVTPAALDPVTGLPIGQPVTSPAARWPDAEILSGRIVRLERLQPELHTRDLWDLTGGNNRAALWQYMSEGPFASKKEFEESMRMAAAKTDPASFAIVNRQTGRAVGRCAYLNIRPEHAVIEVGALLFSSELQQTPGATEALFLMAQYAFDGLHYRRYEWKCNALNSRSRDAAERTGFIFEGIFRQHMVVKGRSRDSAWFSILDSEWPYVRRAFEQWLAAGNFDESGNQRLKLGDLMRRERNIGGA